jgi:eukaryotic-like serine/threonine-protein kinase
MTSSRVGYVVGGRYRLAAELGSGGFGRVWRARDETLDVDVAIKELRLMPGMAPAEQAERLARATREARNAARLRKNENIVAIHDIVVENGLPWIVMDLIDGRSLDEHLRTHGPLPVDRVADIAVALLAAIGAAHREGVVHRDIKPANVMLAEDGKVLLTDFGTAVHDTDTTLTATGMVVGSPEYTAPERLRGTDGLPASDLFSLGATLFQAVEGNSPFRRGTSTATLSAVCWIQPRRRGEPGRSPRSSPGCWARIRTRGRRSPRRWPWSACRPRRRPLRSRCRPAPSRSTPRSSQRVTSGEGRWDGTGRSRC